MNAYVINLDKEYNKWELFLQNNQKYKKYFNFIRFSAINIEENPIKGCFDSHIEIAKINKDEKYYVVFEDDCFIKPNNEKNIEYILNFLENNNNWEVFNGNPNCILKESNFNFNYPLEKIINIKIGKSSNLLIINNKINLWNYSFNNIPFDKFLTTNFSLITFPNYISNQVPGFSSIRNEFVDYRLVFDKSEEFIKNLISKKTLHLHFQGRLGNRLFQLFTALTYCIDNKYLLTCSSGKPNDYNSIILENIPIVDNNPSETLITDKIFFEELILKPNLIKPYFHGFFQNINNFKKYRETFLKYLNIKPRFTSNTLGIHLRKTDYLQKTKTYINYNFKQIQQKINKFPSGLNLLIFTDDIEECQKEIDIEVSYFSGNEKETFETFLGLEYFILSNSTFSWMGAFLNNNLKQGIMPKKWLNHSELNPGSPHQNITIEEY